MIKLIICDLDDTLMSEYDYVLSQFSNVAEFLSVRIGIDAQGVFSDLKTAFDTDCKDPFDRIIKKYSIDESIKNKMIEVYRFSRPNIPLYTDVEMFLEDLSNTDIIMTILTDGNTQRQNMKIDALGIRGYFDIIIVNEPEYFKPKPYGYKAIVKNYSIKPKEILCIGDNPSKDFQYPSQKGYKAVKLNRFVSSEFDNEEYSIPQADSFSEIEELYLL
ncbi:MAG: HAD-IA family hydrolase [candidate division WOR-3 bacterium]|nr:HAD-IA family hydrolase [candidate division WOR-3 bacterium]